MGNNSISNQFRGYEVEQVDNKLYPTIAGRLRLVHEENHDLFIESNLIKYDGKIAIVKAVSTTIKGQFVGHGMASTEQDHQAGLSIVELAENRAIARSLRFSGCGITYECCESLITGKNGNGRIRPAKHSSSEVITAPSPIRTQKDSESNLSV
jgi:hypothetical protein